MIVIYKILNKINNYIYIGSAYNYNKRQKEHIYHLNRQTHKNPHLQAAWNKYGKEAFEFSIIEIIDNKNELIEREQHWLDKTKCYERSIGYNLARIAGSRAGIAMSEEAKNKIKLAMTGRIMLPHVKLAIINANKGNSYCKGKKKSAEHIAKQAAARIGKPLSLEHRSSVAKALKGKPKSDAHKLAISAAAKLWHEAKRATKP